MHAVYYVNGKIYVLTGDFGEAAGIWISERVFSLMPSGSGLAGIPAAWIESIDERVFMATDTQLESNCLYEFRMKMGRP